MLKQIFDLLQYLIDIYIWALILSAVFSLLMSFNVLDRRNRLVWTIGDFLHRVTEPVLAPIRRILPNLGGIDLSPIIVILVLRLLVQPLLSRLYIGIAYGEWRQFLLG